MRHWPLLIVMFTTLVMVARASSDDTLKEGIYGGYRKGGGELIELKGGKYRYWAGTDMVGADSIKYPIKGVYSIHADKIVLEHLRTVLYRSINGHDTLWSPEDLKTWEEKKETFGYVLMRFINNNPTDPWSGCPREMEVEKAIGAKSNGF